MCVLGSCSPPPVTPLPPPRLLVRPASAPISVRIRIMLCVFVFCRSHLTYADYML